MPDNVRKYLLYAIGEIFLVVIGILIALQVNNWNEQRKQNNLEERYMERLVIDLNNDIENLKNSINSTKSRKERAELLLEATENPGVIFNDPTYFVQSIEYGGYTHNPAISDHTFEEIKSSGNLSIIQNEEIKTALSVYYSNRYNQDQFTFIRQDYQLQYLNYQKGILTPAQQIKMGSFDMSESYTDEEAEGVLNRMLKNEPFVNHLPVTIQSNVRTIETFERFKEEAEKLQNSIKSELEKS